MNQHSDIEDRLEELGKSLATRQSCADKVLESMSSKASQQRKVVRAPGFGWRRLVGALSIAASALFIVGWLILSSASTAKAFAEVKQVVAAMKSVIISFESKTQPELNCKIFLLDSGESRQEFANGMVRIFDPKEKRTLGIDPESKTAWFSPEEEPVDSWSQIKRILAVQESAVGKLGQRERNGKPQTGFLVKPEGDAIRVEIWVDPDTRLPVEIQESPVSPDNPYVAHRHVTVRFEFNSDIDASLFRMTTPANFELADSGPYQPTPAFPRDLGAPKLVIKPGIGIGGLTWGDDLADVIACFGPPSELLYHYQSEAGSTCSRTRPDDVVVEHVSVEYSALGLLLSITEDKGLFQIRGEEAIAGFGVRTFRGKTTEGIGIGASLADVLETYGKPSRLSGKKDSPSRVFFGDKGIVFAIENGRVTAVFSSPPEKE